MAFEGLSTEEANMIMQSDIAEMKEKLRSLSFVSKTTSYQDDLQTLFAYFDQDNDSYLSKTEFRALSFHIGEFLSENSVDEIFNHAGANEHGFSAKNLISWASSTLEFTPDLKLGSQSLVFKAKIEHGPLIESVANLVRGLQTNNIKPQSSVPLTGSEYLGTKVDLDAIKVEVDLGIGYVDETSTGFSLAYNCSAEYAQDIAAQIREQSQLAPRDSPAVYLHTVFLLKPGTIVEYQDNSVLSPLGLLLAEINEPLAEESARYYVSAHSVRPFVENGTEKLSVTFEWSLPITRTKHIADLCHLTNAIESLGVKKAAMELSISKVLTETALLDLSVQAKAHIECSVAGLEYLLACTSRLREEDAAPLHSLLTCLRHVKLGVHAANMAAAAREYPELERFHRFNSLSLLSMIYPSVGPIQHVFTRSVVSCIEGLEAIHAQSMDSVLTARCEFADLLKLLPSPEQYLAYLQENGIGQDDDD